jgi:hypothetical protein
MPKKASMDIIKKFIAIVKRGDLTPDPKKKETTPAGLDCQNVRSARNVASIPSAIMTFISS